MVSPFLQGSKILLKLWKELRSQLTSDKTDQQHLQLVINFWSKAPVGVRALDWDDCGSWPDAWLLIHLNEFDESAVALGMFYTLILSEDERWSSDRCKLLLIKDDVLSQQKIVLSIDNQWFMNYEYRKIIAVNDISNDYYVQQVYDFDGKNYVIKKQ